jgi:hypothetical protein
VILEIYSWNVLTVGSYILITEEIFYNHACLIYRIYDFITRMTYYRKLLTG